jgi:hypothetical protein
MKQTTSPALAYTARSVRLSVMAQVAMALVMVLIAFRVSTMLVIPLTSEDMTAEGKSSLVLLLAGLDDLSLRSELASSPTDLAVWLVGLLGAFPLLLLFAAAFQMWVYFRAAVQPSRSHSQVGSSLWRAAVLVAVASVSLPAVMPLAWAIASYGTAFSQAAMPIRITTEHVILILMSAALFSFAALMQDAEKASDDARSIV